jgi:hypothetical protein
MRRVVEILTRVVYALSGAVLLTIEHRAKFHWAVVFYLALDAWVHWFNAFGVFEHEPRAVINAILPRVLGVGAVAKGGTGHAAAAGGRLRAHRSRCERGNPRQGDDARRSKPDDLHTPRDDS